MRTLALAFALLLLVPAVAAAKTGISLNPPPDGITVDEPWDVSFQYIHNDAPVNPRGVRPIVRIASEDGTVSREVRAHRTYKGLWSARVHFPKPGVWNYTIEGFGRAVADQYWDPVTVKAAPENTAPVKASSAGGGGSFPFGWVGGAAAAALLAGGVVVLIRHRAS
jgi:hypothetical protein